MSNEFDFIQFLDENYNLPVEYPLDKGYNFSHKSFWFPLKEFNNFYLGLTTYLMRYFAVGRQSGKTPPGVFLVESFGEELPEWSWMQTHKILGLVKRYVDFMSAEAGTAHRHVVYGKQFMESMQAAADKKEVFSFR